MPDSVLANPVSICLASASPRRRDLLHQLGLVVHVQAVDIDETRRHGESPQDYCVRLAMQKNRTAVERFNPTQPIVAADTIVVLGDQTLGKPLNREAVIQTLKQLSGQCHQVMTAVAVSHRGHALYDLQISEVCFAPIDDKWIQAYADTEEPYDKAGAYGIQGAAACFIATISGSYSGIMGLPLFETARLLRQLDIIAYGPQQQQQTL